MKENLYNQKQNFEQIKLKSTNKDQFEAKAQLKEQEYKPPEQPKVDATEHKYHSKASKQHEPAEVPTLLNPPSHNEMAILKKLIVSFQ